MQLDATHTSQKIKVMEDRCQDRYAAKDGLPTGENVIFCNYRHATRSKSEQLFVMFSFGIMEAKPLNKCL